MSGDERARERAAVHRAGYVAVVGRPNVGKSTLLNHLVGQKLSIVSRKPQTTRLPISGIVTRERAQVVFVDTPGYQTEHRSALNRVMNRSVLGALQEVHAALWVVEALKFDRGDRAIGEILPQRLPVVLAINKIDRIRDRKVLLPFLEELARVRAFAALVPISAARGTQLPALLDAVSGLLPEGPNLFEADELTTVTERVLAAELLREKLFNLLGDELPYSIAVEIEQFRLEEGLRRIHAVILVGKDGHKGIVIGKGGAHLKTIATRARHDMERLFGGKVFLEIMVKVRKGWADDAAVLSRLGYDSARDMSTLGRLLGGLMTRVRGRGMAPGTVPGTQDAAEVNALFQCCLQLSESGELEEACECYRKLLHLDPLHARGRNNLGVLHQRRGEFETAARFEEAARIDPGLAEPHVNLGNLHDIRGDPDAAVPCYRRALEIDPAYTQAHCCLAQALLATGCYEEGWEELEWRWRAQGMAAQRLPPFPQPLWDGSQGIAGKRILLHAEQGYGDAIQFIRYAPLIAARGAHAIAICDPALTGLFRSVPGVAAVVEPGAPLPDFDCHAPLMSLPRAFRTTLATIPAPIPYVAPEPAAVEAWRARLSVHGAPLKVGLAWAGSPTFIAAAMKACPLERLVPLLDTPGCDFFSLQKGEAASDLRQPGPWSGRIVDYTGELRDFADTAALVSALDLVISIDTAAAHLAGALGKPLWLLLAAAPDWRWLPRAGALAWYPTATLFRQRAGADWTGVVDDARRALVERIGAVGAT